MIRMNVREILAPVPVWFEEPSLVLMLVLLIWFLMRLFKGISIIFDAYLMKVYIIGSLVLLGVLSVGYVYLDYSQSTSMYLSYMYDVVVHSQ